MCGSGTDSAIRSRDGSHARFPPGLTSRFAFLEWPGADRCRAPLELARSSNARKRRVAESFHPPFAQIGASDRDAGERSSRRTPTHATGPGVRRMTCSLAVQAPSAARSGGEGFSGLLSEPAPTVSASARGNRGRQESLCAAREHRFSASFNWLGSVAHAPPLEHAPSKRRRRSRSMNAFKNDELRDSRAAGRRSDRSFEHCP